MSFAENGLPAVSSELIGCVPQTGILAWPGFYYDKLALTMMSFEYFHSLKYYETHLNEVSD